MVRLKFFLFALLVLGLGLAHLPLVSGPLGARAVEGASAQASVATSEVARALEGRRLVVQGLALKLAASPDVAAALYPEVVTLPRGKGIRIVEAPLSKRFAGVRAAARDLVPEAMKDSVVLGLATSEGALHARSDDKLASEETLDVQALVKAGTEGVVVDSLDAPHLFFAVPVQWSAEGGPPQHVGTVLVGAPLTVDAEALEAAAKDSGAIALALVRGDTVLGSAGPQKALADKAVQSVKPGLSSQVVERGSVKGLLEQLPQVKLPVLTTKDDYLGGKAVLSVGSRRALPEGFEVVAVTSVKPAMAALADYQRTAAQALVGLLGFSLLWMLVMGSGKRAAAAEAPAAPAKKEEKKKGKKAKKGEEQASEAEAPVPAAAESPTAMLAPVPEAPTASPDDFHFPPSSPPAPAPAPAADPFAAQGDAFPFPPAPAPAADPYASQGGDAFPFPPAPPPGSDPYAAQGGDAFPFPPAPPVAAPSQASARRGAFAFEDQPTAAYSLQQAADPFGAANAQAAAPLSDYADSPPETTRVAAIPQELLQAAARPATVETPIPRGASPAPLAPTPVMGSPLPRAASNPAMGNSAVALSEEQHFQDVFREFVSTREQCGEPNDGLTYDKFVAKLRKNKEQLVQKYACKTVRFQVYVKEGKAALKATPVKD